MPEDEKVKEALKVIAEYCNYRLENDNCEGCDGCLVNKIEACYIATAPYHWKIWEIEALNGK